MTSYAFMHDLKHITRTCCKTEKNDIITFGSRSNKGREEAGEK